LISEYQLGDYGFLMSLAFCLLGANALLLALSLRPRLRTRGGHVGELFAIAWPWSAWADDSGRKTADSS
jgi:hypothetical protein